MDRARRGSARTEAPARALVASLPDAGPIFAYNAGFETQALRRLAELAPDHAQGLHALAGRIFDLLPVTRAAYYHRDVHGSWSIKSVVPTLDPKLGYDRLDTVREGDGAQRAFLALRGGGIPDAEAQTLRRSLLAYCRHDTEVMVALRRFLCAPTAGTAANI